ncbi:MAG TPA: cupin domain-containing protein [Nitrospiria bacterium]|nr:cupin domain-containing protein [Nitrospiria bacterium]
MSESGLFENLPEGVQLLRWPHSHRLPESEIVAYFSAHERDCSRWDKEANAEYPAHDHAYQKILFCVEGEMTFTLAETGIEIPLKPGDRLIIPKGVRHSAVVGPDGVSCIEARES